MDTLKAEERSYLHNLLKHLVACKGRSCTVGHHNTQHSSSRARGNVLPIHTINHQRYKKKKFLDDGKIFLVILKQSFIYLNFKMTRLVKLHLL